MKRICRILLAAHAPLLLVGCATIFHGFEQNVSITSNPPGAHAIVLPDRIELTTPASVSLGRKKVRTVRFAMDGYQPVNAYLDRMPSSMVLLNVIAGGIPGMIVDMETGGGFNLLPDPLHVDLRPIAAEEPDSSVQGARAVRATGEP